MMTSQEAYLALFYQSSKLTQPGWIPLSYLYVKRNGAIAWNNGTELSHQTIANLFSNSDFTWQIYQDPGAKPQFHIWHHELHPVED